MGDIFGDMLIPSINSKIGNIQDGTIADTTNKDTLMGRTYKMKQMIENLDTKVSSSDSDSDIYLVIDFLFSDDNERIEWAFKQDCIGEALNKIGNFNSDALAACHSVNEIAANSELVTMIAGNVQVLFICLLNPILEETILSYLTTEDILAYGYGYSQYAVGDIVTLKYYGKDREFRVIAKDHYTTGKILLFPETILETHKWDGSANNYSASSIRGYLNDYVLSGFSNKIQASLTTPALQCHNGATATTCNDKIWLLSTVELGQAKGTRFAPDEGEAIAWFNSNTRRIRKMNNDGTLYWTRTPNTESGNTKFVWLVTADGSLSSDTLDYNFGVAFAFEI